MSSRSNNNRSKRLEIFGCNSRTRPRDKEYDRQWDMNLWSKVWPQVKLPTGSDLTDYTEWSETHRCRLRSEDVAKHITRKLLFQVAGFRARDIADLRHYENPFICDRSD